MYKAQEVTFYMKIMHKVKIQTIIIVFKKQEKNSLIGPPLCLWLVYSGGLNK